MADLNLKRTTLAKVVYYPTLFFTGIGLSLGSQIGIGGVGLNELFLISTILLFIFILPGCIGLYRRFFITHQITTLAVLFLMVFYSIGYFVGLLYAPDERAIFQSARLFIYAFLFLAIPYIAVMSGVSTPKRDLMVLTLGVAVSALANFGLFLFGSHFDPSLPGQNMIGQNVALFFPFLIYLLWTNKSSGKRFLILAMIFLFVVASLFSWSKGSWLGILGGVLIMLLFNGRRGFYMAAIMATLITPILLSYYDEIMHIYSVEMTASEGSNSMPQRLATILSGFCIALDHPFGVGTAYEHVAANYQSVTGMYWIQPDPHNTLAHIASQAGFLAVFSFIAINLGAIYSAISSKITDDIFKKMLAVIFIVGLFLMQLSGEFITQAFWWLILGIMFASKNSPPFCKRIVA